MIPKRGGRVGMLIAGVCALTASAPLPAEAVDAKGRMLAFTSITAPLPMALGTTSPFQTSAQQGTITGRVTDAATGGPISSASVQLLGTERGTLTDVDGTFHLTGVAAGTHRVRVSLIGYAPAEQEVAVTSGATATLAFELTPQAVQTEGIVVVGYGTQQRANVTGSLDVATTADLVGRPAPNASTALQGVLPGVTIVSPTAQPGAQGNNIRIRGIGTLGDANPLILIDGIEGTLDILNPSDIESITVLKDAAAAAIYGARGANGVILVTTKRGAQDAPMRIQYSGMYGLQRPTRLPNFLGSLEFMELANEAMRNVGQPITYTDEMFEAVRTGSDPNYYADTDWTAALFRNSAPQHNHNLSLTGGSENTSYYLSYGLLQQDGIIVGNNYGTNRHNLRMRLNADVSNRFSLDGIFGYIDREVYEPSWNTGAGGGPVYSSTTIAPLVPVRFTTGGWGYGGGSTNPVAIAYDGGRNTFQSQETTLNFDGNYRLLDGLNLRGQYGQVMSNSRRDIFTARVDYFRPEDGAFWYTSTPLNSLDSRDYVNRYQSVTGTLDFEREFGDHGVQMLAGASREWNRNDYFRGTRQDFISEDIQVLDAGTINERNYGNAGHWALESFFGRFNYDFAERYLFEANVRYDGSSRFAPGNRWGLFPSVSAGWRLIDEPFMDFLAPTFADLKLRASWGRLGNQYVGSGLYPYIASIDPVGTMPLGGNLTRAFAQTQAPNPALSWESIEMTNVGLDFALLEGRLGITTDWFTKTTDDILLRVPLPDVLGIAEPDQNAGAVKNEGWELAVDWRDAIGDFSYSLRANYSDVRNQVTSLGGVPPTIGGEIRMVGQPIDAWYGLVADRLAQESDFTTDANGRLVPNFPVIAGDAARIGPGDIIYKDLNGDGVITLDDDRTVIGNPHPRHTFGLRGSGEWRGIDASFFLQGVGKRDGHVWGSARHAFITQSAYPQEVHRDRWTPENTDASYPRLTFQQEHNVRLSTWWVDDASYVRLKNLQVGYTPGERLTQSLPVDRMRIYISGDNLFTLTDYFYAYDPEAPGRQGGYYPQVRTFSIGVDANF